MRKASLAPKKAAPSKRPVVQKNVGGRPPNNPIKGDVIRRKREAMGLSRNQLVKRLQDAGCKVTGSSLYLWEKEQTSPSDASLAHLCNELSLRPEEVMRGVG